MQRTVTLTANEVALLSTALWTASERYGEYAYSMRGVDNIIQEQFEKQKREALALHKRIERADAVQLVESPEEESNIEQARRRG